MANPKYLSSCLNLSYVSLVSSLCRTLQSCENSEGVAISSSLHIRLMGGGRCIREKPSQFEGKSSLVPNYEIMPMRPNSASKRFRRVGDHILASGFVSIVATTGLTKEFQGRRLTARGTSATPSCVKLAKTFCLIDSRGAAIVHRVMEPPTGRKSSRTCAIWFGALESHRLRWHANRISGLHSCHRQRGRRSGYAADRIQTDSSANACKTGGSSGGGWLASIAVVIRWNTALHRPGSDLLAPRPGHSPARKLASPLDQVDWFWWSARCFPALRG